MDGCSPLRTCRHWCANIWRRWIRWVSWTEVSSKIWKRMWKNGLIRPLGKERIPFLGYRRNAFTCIVSTLNGTQSGFFQRLKSDHQLPSGNRTKSMRLTLERVSWDFNSRFHIRWRSMKESEQEINSFIINVLFISAKRMPKARRHMRSENLVRSTMKRHISTTRKWLRGCVPNADFHLLIVETIIRAISPPIV